MLGLERHFRINPMEQAIVDFEDLLPQAAFTVDYSFTFYTPDIEVANHP